MQTMATVVTLEDVGKLINSGFPRPAIRNNREMYFPPTSTQSVVLCIILQWGQP